MAIIVETGEIVPNAESYVSVAECDLYHANRGNSLWTGIDSVKESALRKAVAYLDGNYRSRWKGDRVSFGTQALEWPRYNVEVPGGGLFGFAAFNNWLPSDSIPQRLKDAQCELALRALTAELAADATGNIKREKVDVLETEYFANSVPKQVYTIVDQLLSDYITPLGSGYVVRG